MNSGGFMASYLVVIYGTAGVNKEVAWRLARGLPGKSAVLSMDAFLDGAIAQPSKDAGEELDMAHTQLRLLVANYMRNGYNVVVEGVFYYERDGQQYRYEQDIDQLVALMRNMTRKALTVHVPAPASGGEDGFEYRPRYGGGAMTVDADATAEDIAKAVHEKLMAEKLT
jgi:hypothetical protein